MDVTDTQRQGLAEPMSHVTCIRPLYIAIPAGLKMMKVSIGTITIKPETREEEEE